MAQYFEIRWWKRYLNGKSPAAYFQWKRDYWSNFLEKWQIRPLPGQRVLDAGCGPAGIFMEMESNDVDAIDPLYNAYKARFPELFTFYRPNVHFHNAQIEAYSAPQPYDFIYCLNCINHVQNMENALQNLYALGAPNATLILTTDAHNYAFLKFIFSLVPGDILHPHQYMIDQYCQKTANAGWQVTAVHPIQKEGIFTYFLITAIKA